MRKIFQVKRQIEKSEALVSEHDAREFWEQTETNCSEILRECDTKVLSDYKNRQKRQNGFEQKNENLQFERNKVKY